MQKCGAKDCKKNGVHRWGSYLLCDDCHKKYLEECKSKDRSASIFIPEETRFSVFSIVGGWYTQGKSKIYLIESPYSIEEVLNHENIHRIINIFIDPQASYNYDNVKHHVDPCHGLS